MNIKIFLAIGIMMSIATSSYAQPRVGDNAPPLYIIKWLKGKPVPSFEKGKVYVVEFGYVACPPCRAAIPHLTEIAQKYRKEGKVEVISIFTVESNPKVPSDLSYIKKVQGLVDFMDDKMDYTVAVDEPTQKTNEAWGKSSRFPFIFIVNQEGKLATKRLGTHGEIDFALESIVKTGSYDPDVFLAKNKLKSDSLDAIINAFEARQELLKERGNYKGIIQALDSAIIQFPVAKKENLLFRKFKTYLTVGDSIAADKALGEIVLNKIDGWEGLHARFAGLALPAVGQSFRFNFKLYLDIADRAIAEVSLPSLQADHLNIKARIIFGYQHDKKAAMAALNKALMLVKSGGDTKSIKRVQDDIQNLEDEERRSKLINADWQVFKESLKHPSEKEWEDVKAFSKNNLYEHQYLYQNSQKQLALAEQFLNKYPMLRDNRVYVALYFYLEGNNLLNPWVANISAEKSDSLKNMIDSLRKDFSKYPKRQLRFDAPWARAIPRDIKAETEWLRKGDVFVRQIKEDVNTTAEENESLDWAVFVRDWRTAASIWSIMPRQDQQANDNINKLETNYWQRAATQYWGSFWKRFNEHVEKYIELPIIVSRAPGFLSGMEGYSLELTMSYWQKLNDKYGDPKHPLAANENVQALHKITEDKLHVFKIKHNMAPVDMKFTAMDGRQINLADYRGKVVLIDFWASWCKPCVGEMPKLKAVYDKYHDKGFEMIGICLDKENKREEVRQLIAKNSLIGPQRFEGKGFDGDRFKQLYGIFGLPTVWLLDKNGVLVSTHARGEELIRLLDKYLGASK